MLRSFLTLLLLLATACGRKSEVPLVQETQSFADLSPSIQVADPKATPQLVKGWHEVEQGSWRWTQKQFSVVLKAPPVGKASNLQLKFVIPEVLIQRLTSITLSASVNGTPLAPETYSKAGEQVYTRSVAGVAGDAARIDFTLDKAIPPGDTDRRELGIVVSAIGFE